MIQTTSHPIHIGHCRKIQFVWDEDEDDLNKDDDDNLDDDASISLTKDDNSDKDGDTSDLDNEDKEDTMETGMIDQFG